ncbi:MAG TPA: hypothetical protein DDY49_14060 [Paenibacillaceae bacterium]|nr:hypothetical protein [Paenibacillaceae bacterium]
MKIVKRISLGLAFIMIFGVIVTVSAIAIMEDKTQKINNNLSSVFTDEKYIKAVSVDDIQVITQSISCGYATIEIFSSWNGGDITETALFEEYGKVVTSTGKSFCEEMNKQFPEYSTTMYSYLPNTELLDKVYISLSKGMPVPFEWAAQYDNEWTLHYSLITSLDLKNDNITVLNPYGYIEELTIKDFLNRTSFNAYENLPFYLKLGFAFGLFEKNTIFIVE